MLFSISKWPCIWVFVVFRDGGGGGLGFARPEPLGLDTVKWNGCRVQGGRVTKPSCHLSPLMGHESLQTFGGCHHHKVTLSWKHAQARVQTHNHTHTKKNCQIVLFFMSGYMSAHLHQLPLRTRMCRSVSVHPSLQIVQEAQAAACRFNACWCALCVFYANAPPVFPPSHHYYSWLVDGCWLSHLPDFVPARCRGVTGKAPKHSSISTTVQLSFSSGCDCPISI